MAQKIIDKIFYEYDGIRARTALQRDSRVEKYHGMFPELEEIKKDFVAAGMKLASGIMSSPEREKELRAEYDKEAEKLLERKNRILKENDIPEDYDKIRYECELCKDTGYINNEKCRCLIKKKIAHLYEKSNLSERMKNQNFDGFSLDYYSEIAADGKISPREKAEKAFKTAKDMVENFETADRSIMFAGNVGLGKTYLSSCIANGLIERGYSVLYIRSGTLFSLLENRKFNKIPDDDEVFDSINNCDMLIIDDLGTEVPSKFTASFFYDLICERFLGGKKMVISTNLSIDELSRLYTPRFISRLYDNFYYFRLEGTDIRKTKAYE